MRIGSFYNEEESDNWFVLQAYEKEGRQKSHCCLFSPKQTIHDPTFLAHYESRPEVVGCKGCKIDWVKGMNLTLRPVRKADKNTGKIVTKFAVSIILTLKKFFGNH